MPPEIQSHTANWFDAQLGRQPCQVPAHLSRILYIPRHDHMTAHLPLYEAGDQYRKAVKDSLLGSTIYTTLLGLMKKPLGDNSDDQVAYLTDIYRTDDGDVQIQLDQRELAKCGSEIQLTMATPSSRSGASAMFIECNAISVKIDISFPIPESFRGCEMINHPYFTVAIPMTDSRTPTIHEWQIHPAKDGILRYTLVQKDESLESGICAIYHHMGWDLSLSVGYSEGILLLPESHKNTDVEGIVVASLLGVLWQLRILGTCRRKRTKESAQVGNILRRVVASIFGHSHT